MKKLLCSILDCATNQYNIPFCTENENTARRMFARSVSGTDPDSIAQAYPEDFHLYAVGEFDMDVGVPVPFDTPKRLATGSEFKYQVREPEPDSIE